MLAIKGLGQEKYTRTYIWNLAQYTLAGEFPVTALKLSEIESSNYSFSFDVLTSGDLIGMDDYREAWEIAQDFNRPQEGLL